MPDWNHVAELPLEEQVPIEGLAPRRIGLQLKEYELTLKLVRSRGQFLVRRHAA